MPAIRDNQKVSQVGFKKHLFNEIVVVVVKDDHVINLLSLFLRDKKTLYISLPILFLSHFCPYLLPT